MNNHLSDKEIKIVNFIQTDQEEKFVKFVNNILANTFLCVNFYLNRIYSSTHTVGNYVMRTFIEASIIILFI